MTDLASKKQKIIQIIFEYQVKNQIIKHEAIIGYELLKARIANASKTLAIEKAETAKENG